MMYAFLFSVVGYRGASHSRIISRSRSTASERTRTSSHHGEIERKGRNDGMHDLLHRIMHSFHNGHKNFDDSSVVFVIRFEKVWKYENVILSSSDC